MFTGIIEELGTIKEVRRQAGGLRLVISAKEILKDIKIGDSISINGVCLTNVFIENGSISFDVVSETVHRTNLGDLKVLCKVNLERAIISGKRFGGHFVTGHIDYKARIIELKNIAGNISMEISLPEEFLKYIAQKGSIAVDGVSLTVAEVGKSFFSIYLIPYTFKNTTLGLKKRGDFVNVETDILAKYVDKKENRPAITVEFLNKYGYI